VIAFGPWSTILGLGVAFGLVVALALLGCRQNRSANRLLAALLVLIALRLMPYVLGYAGFYDAYRWLSFAPFDLALGIGPLLYLHVARLTTAALEDGWYWHLLPMLLQFLYYLAVFLTPLDFKNAWNASVHVPFVNPLENLAEVLSIGCYLGLAWRRHTDYQRFINAHLSHTDPFALRWQRNVIIAMALMLLIWAGYAIATAALELNYFQRFPLYLGLTALVYYLGLEGWRHAEQSYPLPAPVEVLDETAIEPGRDWRAQAEIWLKATRESARFRDPELNLERLAKHLGTNTAYLSRALNEGLGMSFSEAIAQLRVAHICAELDSGNRADLLELALEAGFSAKSSFNRVFKAQSGQTPSQYRQRASQSLKNASH